MNRLSIIDKRRKMPYESRPLKNWQGQGFNRPSFSGNRRSKKRNKILVASAGVLPAEILSGMDVEWIFARFMPPSMPPLEDSPSCMKPANRRDMTGTCATI